MYIGDEGLRAKETLIPHELPTRAWQILGTDLFHFDNKEYLIVADYYSKFPFIRKMPTPCASHAVVTATADIFSEHGSPAKVLSDNGGHYDCANYRNFAESWGFEHVTSSPHYPQLNGFIERSIQTVKRTLKKAKESNTDASKALLCLRSTPIDYHLPSPSELLYARKLKGDLPIQIRNPLTHRDEIQSRLSERQDTQKAYHDTHTHNLRPLEAGQPVRIQDHVSGRWNKASITERCEQPRAYLVESENGNILRRNRIHIRETPPVRRLVRFADPVSDQVQVSPTQPTQTRRGELQHAPPDGAQTGARPVAADVPNDITRHSYYTRSGRAVSTPKRFDL